MSTFTKSRRVALGFRSARNISRDKKRLDLDMLVKILGIAFTPITILIGINQYNHGVEREFRKNYYVAKLLLVILIRLKRRAFLTWKQNLMKIIMESFRFLKT